LSAPHAAFVYNLLALELLKRTKGIAYIATGPPPIITATPSASGIFGARRASGEHVADMKGDTPLAANSHSGETYRSPGLKRL